MFLENHIWRFQFVFNVTCSRVENNHIIAHFVGLHTLSVTGNRMVSTEAFVFHVSLWCCSNRNCPGCGHSCVRGCLAVVCSCDLGRLRTGGEVVVFRVMLKSKFASALPKTTGIVY